MEYTLRRKDAACYVLIYDSRSVLAYDKSRRGFFWVEFFAAVRDVTAWCVIFYSNYFSLAFTTPGGTTSTSPKPWRVSMAAR
ncbi:MAG: hypothetical protein ACK4SY_09230, partial [Pyrobaculum sp.]